MFRHFSSSRTAGTAAGLTPSLVVGAVFAVSLASFGEFVPVAAQTSRTAANAAGAAATASEFRTPWGHPDLQGIWSNSTITPLERPARYEGRAFLTEEEVRALDAAETTRGDQRSANAAADVDAAYNQFWWDRGKTVGSRRTSLVIDPPDGRIPALTPEGQKQAAAVTARLRGAADGPEDRNLAERCVTRGAPKLPGGYNNNFQIVQTPTHVAIMQEMIHETRIIPLDGRAHLPTALRQWLGDSRGRWEGDTLVVETTNYHELSPFNSYNCCRGSGKHLRIVERFRRIDANTIDHQFTVEDPVTFTRSYTVAVPLQRIDEPIFEYACHEGNYGMEGILRGARAQER
jgi:hypothetical protein